MIQMKNINGFIIGFIRNPVFADAEQDVSNDIWDTVFSNVRSLIRLRGYERSNMIKEDEINKLYVHDI